MDMSDPGFWLSALQIIFVNIVLSGDNAVVIAMACRSLPPRQRLWGMILGSGVAVLLRIAFTGIVIRVMTLPYLKFAGGLALLWIAVKLISSGDGDEKKIKGGENLWRAVWIVAIADIVMSLDNVIAIAAAAEGNIGLTIFGLGVSVPLIVGCAAIVMALLDRFPILAWAGAALLGWIAGKIMAEDPGVEAFLGQAVPQNYAYAAAMAGVILVLGLGYAWQRMQERADTSAKN